jgi:hypothetical protein
MIPTGVRDVGFKTGTTHDFYGFGLWRFVSSGQSALMTRFAATLSLLNRRITRRNFISTLNVPTTPGSVVGAGIRLKWLQPGIKHDFGSCVMVKTKTF